MRLNLRAIATKALYVLLAFIIATGGYFAKPPEPAQADWKEWVAWAEVQDSTTVILRAYITCNSLPDFCVWDCWFNGVVGDSGNLQWPKGMCFLSAIPGTKFYAWSKGGLTPGQNYNQTFIWRETDGGIQHTYNFSWTQTCNIPSVTTNAASSIGTTTATINGYLNGIGSNPASLSFATSWAGVVAGSPSSSSSATSFTYSASGLAPGTTYTYDAQASNTCVRGRNGVFHHSKTPFRDHQCGLGINLSVGHSQR